jgi:hypothetical protein
MRPRATLPLGLLGILLIFFIHRSCRSRHEREPRSSGALSTRKAPEPPYSDRTSLQRDPLIVDDPASHLTDPSHKEELPPSGASSPASTTSSPSPRPFAEAPPRLPPSRSPLAPAVPPTKSGAIRGVVRLKEAPPSPAIHSLDSAPSCRQRHPEGRPDESLMVGKGLGICNALVYIAQSEAPGDPPPPVVGSSIMDCRFVPRVVGVLPLQSFEVRNEDESAHDLLRGDLEGFAMEPGAKTRMKWSGPRGPFRLGCRAHAWETGWAVVVPNTWFTLTDGDGEFVLEGVPSGDRTLAIWHERYQEPTFRRVQIEGTPSAPVEIVLPLPK